MPWQNASRTISSRNTPTKVHLLVLHRRQEEECPTYSIQHHPILASASTSRPDTSRKRLFSCERRRRWLNLNALDVRKPMSCDKDSAVMIVKTTGIVRSAPQDTRRSRVGECIVAAQNTTTTICEGQGTLRRKGRGIILVGLGTLLLQISCPRSVGSISSPSYTYIVSIFPQCTLRGNCRHYHYNQLTEIEIWDRAII